MVSFKAILPDIQGAVKCGQDEWRVTFAVPASDTSPELLKLFGRVLQVSVSDEGEVPLKKSDIKPIPPPKGHKYTRSQQLRFALQHCYNKRELPVPFDEYYDEFMKMLIDDIEEVEDVWFKMRKRYKKAGLSISFEEYVSKSLEKLNEAF